MEVMKNEIPKQEEEVKKESTVKKTHEEYMREFAGKLNEILQSGYPLPSVIQVLDSALFEMKLSLYFQQVEMMEKAKKGRIEIPNMQIPTGKMK